MLCRFSLRTGVHAFELNQRLLFHPLAYGMFSLLGVMRFVSGADLYSHPLQQSA